MFRLEVKDHFDAAHRLLGYEGKCSSTHGHKVDVVVGIQGNKLDDLGMLVDFSEVKKVLKERLDKYDHKLILNTEDIRGRDTFYEDEIVCLFGNPTAENFAYILFVQLGNCLNCKEYKVEFIKVYESPDCCVTYREYE